MVYELVGIVENRGVWLNGEKLDPKESLQHRNHSSDGFNWGYLGSGPSQLALAVALKLFDKYTALANYPRLKEQIISHLDREKCFVIRFEVAGLSHAEGWRANFVVISLILYPSMEKLRASMTNNYVY